MPSSPPPSFTAFSAGARIAAGPLIEVAVAVQAAHAAGAAHILVFDDCDGRPVELDLRGSPEELRARLEGPTIPAVAPAGRGRPKLGVTAREVTLLPSQIMLKTRRTVKNKKRTNHTLPRRRVNPLAS